MLTRHSEFVFKAVSVDDHDMVYDSMVITVDVTADEGTVVVPDVIGKSYLYTYWYWKEEGFKPKFTFSKYHKGKVAQVVAQKPKAHSTAHKGDRVTITLGGWKRDDVQLSVRKPK